MLVLMHIEMRLLFHDSEGGMTIRGKSARECEPFLNASWS